MGKERKKIIKGGEIDIRTNFYTICFWDDSNGVILLGVFEVVDLRRKVLYTIYED